LVEGVPSPERRRRWTYAELLAESEQAARALLGRFSPGERVAVWANNIPEWILLEMGAALAGITLVTVNPALRADEVRHVLEQSRAAGIFLRNEYRGNPMAETLSGIRSYLPELREVVPFDEWGAFGKSGLNSQVLPGVRPDDPAQIQYTSGTTGVPKGAVLRHRSVANCGRLSYAPALGMRRGDVFVNPMPLFHTAGCGLATMASVASLGTHVLMPYFDPALQLSLIESERSMVFGGVPTMLIALLNHPDFGRTDLSSVRVALSGGAVVQPALVKRVEAEVGVPMTIVYGQTEGCPITMTRYDDPEQDRADTLGRPLPGIDVKIVDVSSDDAATVPAGTVGEICTRGYHVMTGYFDAPEQTRAAIDPDGWLHTGDLGSMDRRGYLRIGGRLKEMIIRGGENIYPAEIEQVLLTHPSVLDVAVVGVPDEVWGEQVAAFIRLVPGAAANPEELFAYIRARLAPHKAPRVWEFVDEFPLTGSGKVRKFALRERLVSG
jgi:fatty-acyl-CoA synthase